MGDSHNPFHIPVLAVLATVVEASVVGVLVWLQPHEFWMGFGAAGVLIIPAAVLAWYLANKGNRDAAAAVAANLAAEQGRVALAEAQLKEAKRGTEIRETGLEMLHKAVEAVRRAAIARKQSGGYSREQFKDDVRQLLETRFREYMHARLGGQIEYAVTVKWIHTGADRRRRLAPVFRDSIQGAKRATASDEDLEGNYFYEKFKAGEHVENDLLCLVVHDTQLDEIPAGLKNRARDRRYNSCLVIPLNLPLPAPFEASDGFGLVGFLSVDAPKSWIFTSFFDKLDASRDFGCQGQNHVRKPELNLLYGLADSIATIYLLTEQEGANGK